MAADRMARKCSWGSLLGERGVVDHGSAACWAGPLRCWSAGGGERAEPVLEPGLAELGVFAGHQAAVGQRGPEVARVGVGDHVTRVVARAQGVVDELVEAVRL